MPSTSLFGLPWGRWGKESTCNAGDTGSIPGSGRSPGGGHGSHSSILASRILWIEGPGRLQSIGSQRIVKLLSRVRLCDPMECSLPGSSVHGIFEARVLEWVAISFSRGSSQPRDWTQVSHVAGRLLRAGQDWNDLARTRSCFMMLF